MVVMRCTLRLPSLTSLTYFTSLSPASVSIDGDVVVAILLACLSFQDIIQVWTALIVSQTPPSWYYKSAYGGCGNSYLAN